MADGFILSTLPVTYQSAWQGFVTMLTTAGWTAQSSGNGNATYSAVNGTAFYAVGFASGNWIRLRSPDGVREIILSTNATSGFRLKYSVAAGFTGGTPSAVNVPTATDQQHVQGTDGPTYQTVPTYPSAITRAHGKANGTAPYGFWYGNSTVASSPSLMIVFDPVSGVSADNDKYVWHSRASQSFSGGNMVNSPDTVDASSQTAVCFWNTGLTTWLGADPAGTYSGSSGVGYSGVGFTVNPFDNTKHDMLPILYQRYSGRPTAQGLKGYSTMLRWTATSLTNVVQATTDKLWIVYGSCWVPWDGVTVPVN